MELNCKLRLLLQEPNPSISSIKKLLLQKANPNLLVYFQISRPRNIECVFDLINEYSVPINNYVICRSGINFEIIEKLLDFGANPFRQYGLNIWSIIITLDDKYDILVKKCLLYNNPIIGYEITYIKSELIFSTVIGYLIDNSLLNKKYNSYARKWIMKNPSSSVRELFPNGFENEKGSYDQLNDIEKLEAGYYSLEIYLRSKKYSHIEYEDVFYFFWKNGGHINNIISFFTTERHIEFGLKIGVNLIELSNKCRELKMEAKVVNDIKEIQSSYGF